MMQVTEMIGRKSGMFKVMLTVFTANAGAQAFYRTKLGYTTDPCSPSAQGDMNPTHDILSKELPRKKEDADR